MVVGTGPDIVCLAAGVLLWRDRLRAGLQIHRFIVRGFESPVRLQHWWQRWPTSVSAVDYCIVPDEFVNGSWSMRVKIDGLRRVKMGDGSRRVKAKGLMDLGG